MTDAKRIFEKYKNGEEEVKQREAALQAEIDRLEKEGGGREEMEMHMAGLKRDLAQAAEDVDTAKGKLSQLKKLAEERLKSDRAKYLAHIEELKQAREGSRSAMMVRIGRRRRRRGQTPILRRRRCSTRWRPAWVRCSKASGRTFRTFTGVPRSYDTAPPLGPP
ncbi:hypothetical protein T484DRAFT_1916432 [Baffinella frigidus]|nr:hypothetical protein T484DRAFT_1916432 [Cryptophyta sp. CCMP2293]